MRRVAWSAERLNQFGANLFDVRRDLARVAARPVRANNERNHPDLLARRARRASRKAPIAVRGGRSEQTAQGSEYGGGGGCFRIDEAWREVVNTYSPSL